MRNTRLSLMLRRFLADEEATITVEFVIVLPLIMLWFVGSFVFFQTFRTYSQAEKASYTIADIMSRQVEVTPAFVDQMFTLLGRLLPQAPTGQTVRISSITYQGSDYVVQWSRGIGGITALTSATAPDSILPEIGDGDSVILTETYVPYRPMVDWVGIPQMTWANRVVTRPRFVASVVLTP